MIQPYNIFDLANQNRATLQDSYAMCCTCTDKNIREKFEEHLLQKGEVTIATFSGFAFEEQTDGQMLCIGRNGKELVLSEILRVGRYLNAYERYATEDERREHFSKFKDSRTVFDGSFTEGTKFKYLNFNNGQLGIPAFGDFTIAFPLNYFANDQIIFLKYNSLWLMEAGSKQCYYFTTDNEAVDIDKFSQDLATISNMLHLVVVKREKELQTDEEIDFNVLILKPIGDSSKHRDYIEAITWQDVMIDKSATLRAARQRYDALVDVISNENTTLGAEVRNIAELQALINKSQQERQMKVEFV